MSTEGVYAGLSFPDAPGDRPYTFINMVTTIDGKIVTGTREESAQDLGSELDPGGTASRFDSVVTT